MDKDGTIINRSCIAVDGTDRFVPTTIQRWKMFPGAKRDALASLDDLLHCASHDEAVGRIEAARSIIEDTVGLY